MHSQVNVSVNILQALEQALDLATTGPFTATNLMFLDSVFQDTVNLLTNEGRSIQQNVSET